MLEHYETDDDYIPSQLEEFASWLDGTIGTEHEVNDTYIIVFDLTQTEIAQIMIFEDFFRKNIEWVKDKLCLINTIHNT